MHERCASCRVRGGPPPGDDLPCECMIGHCDACFNNEHTDCELCVVPVECACDRVYCEACVTGLHELCASCAERGLPPEGQDHRFPCQCLLAIRDACISSDRGGCARCAYFGRALDVGNDQPHTAGSTDVSLAGLGRNSKGDGPGAAAPGSVYYGTVGGPACIAVLVRRVSPTEVRFAVPRSPECDGGIRVRAAEGDGWLDCKVVSRSSARGLVRNPRPGVTYRTWAPPTFEGNSPRWLPSVVDLDAADEPPGAEVLPPLPISQSSTGAMSTQSTTQDTAMPQAFDTWEGALAWWDDIDCEEHLGLRVPTVDFIPTSLATAAADARARVLLAVAQAERGSILEERLWKVLTYFDRILFCVRRGGRTVRRGGKRHAQSPKGQGWERTLAFRFNAFAIGDWHALWREAHPPEAGTIRPRARDRDDVQAKRVEHLVRNGEISKAVAAVFRDSGLADGPDVHAALMKLFPEVPVELTALIADFAAAPGGVPAALRDRIEQGVRECIPRAPRCSAPGPSDSRFEHWSTLAANPAGLAAAGVVLTRFMFGEAPAAAISANLSAVLYALPKPDGGVRPIACGSVIRRLAAKGVCRALASELAAACGPLQFAVGRGGGAEKLHKVITVLSELRPEAAFVKLDFKNAYNSVLRQAVHDGVRGRLPALGAIAATLCPELTSHWWFASDGCGRRIRSVRGVDQGCPLSPALFAIAIAPALEELRTQLRRQDSGAFVLSFLDDIYVVIDPSEVSRTLETARQLFQPIGLELHAGKTRVWSPRGFAPLPPGITRATSFTCLGSAALWVPETCTRVAIASPGGGLASSLDALRAFGVSLTRLRRGGLSLGTALTIHKAWAGGTLTHHMRSNLLDPDFAEEWDDTVDAFWAQELHRPLDLDRRAQLHLPGKDGGCGVPSAAQARIPAYLGSWELCLADVATTLGANSAQQFVAGLPTTRTTIEAAAQALRSYGVTDYSFAWEALVTEPRQRRQHELTGALQDIAFARLMQDLPEVDRVDFRSSGGTGAAGFLEPPTESLHMSDIHLRTAIRARLRLQRPGFDVTLGHTGPVTHCQHRYAKTGAYCGQPLGPEHNPPLCHVGGGWERGHNMVRNWLCKWITEQTGEQADLEQFVPAWNKQLKPTAEFPDGQLVLAKLDVSCMVYGRRTHVDVAIPTAATRFPGIERTARADECGRAAAQKVRDKRERYPPDKNPGEGLVAFVVEALGRPSAEVAAFLRALAPTDPAQRAVVLRSAWQALSILIQTRLAELYISAERPRLPQ